MYRIDKQGEYYTFEDFLRVVKALRSKDGCPWDLEQTHDSIKDAVVEEAYELKEAIINEDLPNLKEELGDLLLQVVLHSQIGDDEGTFNIDDVTDGIVEKMIRRHPHVFEQEESLMPEHSDSVEEGQRISSGQVLDNWDEIKLREKQLHTITDDMRQVAKVLPSLIRSRKVQKKAAKVGFDFPVWQDAYAKVEEEILELKEAIISDNSSHIEEEFGDLLFAIVNISRFLALNPENALTNATEKFINRFEGVETLANTRDLDLKDMSLAQLDALWDEVKISHKKR